MGLLTIAPLCCLLFGVFVYVLEVLRPYAGAAPVDSDVWRATWPATSEVLLGFRLAALAVILGVDFMLFFIDKATFTADTPEGKPMTVTLSGYKRFSTFTVWSWNLQGLYFALTIAGTVFQAELAAWAPAHVDRLPEVAGILFEVSASVSLLVTVIVTFILYVPSVMLSSLSFSLFLSLSLLIPPPTPPPPHPPTHSRHSPTGLPARDRFATCLVSHSNERISIVMMHRYREGAKRNLDMSFFFTAPPLAMHNFNLLFMVC
jgi:hypothetical protein